MTQQTKTTLTQRVVDLLGQDAVDRLHLHRLTVTDLHAAEQFRLAHERSNKRMQDAATAAMRAIGVRVALVDVEERDGCLRLVVCAPWSTDEVAMTQMVGDQLRAELLGPREREDAQEEDQGAQGERGGREARRVGDVAFHTAQPAPEHEAAVLAFQDALDAARTHYADADPTGPWVGRPRTAAEFLDERYRRQWVDDLAGSVRSGVQRLQDGDDRQVAGLRVEQRLLAALLHLELVLGEGDAS